MVDLSQLVNDVLSNALVLLLAPGAYAILFLEAWEPKGEGSGFGFDRRVFWLLLLGALLGSLANIPFFTFRGSVMAINVGGALIPIALSLVLLISLYLPGGSQDLLTLLGGLAGATIVLVLLVVQTGDNVSPLAVFGVLALFGGIALAPFEAHSHRPSGERVKSVLGTYALMAVGVGLTYLTSSAVPGVGIVSSFPFLFAAPVAVGVGALLLRWPKRDGAGLAYAAGTIGVLVGADVLHQPPLYGSPFLGAIGGAGILDLVYLSGPIALITALGLTVIAGRLLGRPLPTTPSAPPQGLEAAYAALMAGRFSEVAVRTTEDVDERAAGTRTSLGLPPTSKGANILGLPLHPLVQGDFLNLQALARRSDISHDEAQKALRAGFYLQRALDEVFIRRLASLGERIWAYLLDLFIALAPGCALLAILVAEAGTSNVLNLVASIPFETVLLAFGAYPFVLWVVTETWTGFTPGKWVMHLQVVDAHLRPPRLLQALSRNTTKLLALTVVTTLIAVAIPLAMDSNVEGLGVSGILGAIVLVGASLGFLGVSGLFSALVMATNPRRQRLGDLMAGTRVIRSRGLQAGMTATLAPAWPTSPRSPHAPA